MIGNEGQCRLCSQQAELCNSHLISEFFYEQMQLYDDKHRFYILSTEPGKHPPTAQKGIRERLLCRECEGKLSQWEGHARGVLYGGESIDITANRSGYECTVDYAKFKLFQLSILWRIGVSTHMAFSSISLGAHENVLRGMLLGETPGNTETYGCVIIHSTRHTDITSNMIRCIGMSDVDGVACAHLLLGGFYWLFFLSETAIDPRQGEPFLQETGHLRILRTDKDLNQSIERVAKVLYSANPDRFNHIK